MVLYTGRAKQKLLHGKKPKAYHAISPNTSAASNRARFKSSRTNPQIAKDAQMKAELMSTTSGLGNASLTYPYIISLSRPINMTSGNNFFGTVPLNNTLNNNVAVFTIFPTAEIREAIRPNNKGIDLPADMDEIGAILRSLPDGSQGVIPDEMKSTLKEATQRRRDKIAEADSTYGPGYRTKYRASGLKGATRMSVFPQNLVSNLITISTDSSEEEISQYGMERSVMWKNFTFTPTAKVSYGSFECICKYVITDYRIITSNTSISYYEYGSASEVNNTVSKGALCVTIESTTTAFPSNHMFLVIGPTSNIYDHVKGSVGGDDDVYLYLQSAGYAGLNYVTSSTGFQSSPKYTYIPPNPKYGIKGGNIFDGYYETTAPEDVGSDIMKHLCQVYHKGVVSLDVATGAKTVGFTCNSVGTVGGYTVDGDSMDSLTTNYAHGTTSDIWLLWKNLTGAWGYRHIFLHVSINVNSNGNQTLRFEVPRGMDLWSYSEYGKDGLDNLVLEPVNTITIKTEAQLHELHQFVPQEFIDYIGVNTAYFTSEAIVNGVSIPLLELVPSGSNISSFMNGQFASEEPRTGTFFTENRGFYEMLVTVHTKTTVDINGTVSNVGTYGDELCVTRLIIFVLPDIGADESVFVAFGKSGDAVIDVRAYSSYTFKPFTSVPDSVVPLKTLGNTTIDFSNKSVGLCVPYNQQNNDGFGSNVMLFRSTRTFRDSNNACWLSIINADLSDSNYSYNSPTNDIIGLVGNGSASRTMAIRYGSNSLTQELVKYLVRNDIDSVNHFNNRVTYGLVANSEFKSNFSSQYLFTEYAVANFGMSMLSISSLSQFVMLDVASSFMTENGLLTSSGTQVTQLALDLKSESSVPSNIRKEVFENVRSVRLVAMEYEYRGVQYRRFYDLAYVSLTKAQGFHTVEAVNDGTRNGALIILDWMIYYVPAYSLLFMELFPGVNPYSLSNGETITSTSDIGIVFTDFHSIPAGILYGDPDEGNVRSGSGETCSFTTTLETVAVTPQVSSDLAIRCYTKTSFSGFSNNLTYALYPCSMSYTRAEVGASKEDILSFYNEIVGFMNTACQKVGSNSTNFTTLAMHSLGAYPVYVTDYTVPASSLVGHMTWAASKELYLAEQFPLLPKYRGELLENLMVDLQWLELLNSPTGAHWSTTYAFNSGVMSWPVVYPNVFEDMEWLQANAQVTNNSANLGYPTWTPEVVWPYTQYFNMIISDNNLSEVGFTTPSYPSNGSNNVVTATCWVEGGGASSVYADQYAIESSFDAYTSDKMAVINWFTSGQNSGAGRSALNYPFNPLNINESYMHDYYYLQTNYTGSNLSPLMSWTMNMTPGEYEIEQTNQKDRPSTLLNSYSYSCQKAGHNHGNLDDARAFPYAWTARGPLNVSTGDTFVTNATTYDDLVTNTCLTAMEFIGNPNSVSSNSSIKNAVANVNLNQYVPYLVPAYARCAAIGCFLTTKEHQIQRTTPMFLPKVTKNGSEYTISNPTINDYDILRASEGKKQTVLALRTHGYTKLCQNGAATSGGVNPAFAGKDTFTKWCKTPQGTAAIAAATAGGLRIIGRISKSWEGYTSWIKASNALKVGGNKYVGTKLEDVTDELGDDCFEIDLCQDTEALLRPSAFGYVIRATYRIVRSMKNITTAVSEAFENCFKISDYIGRFFKIFENITVNTQDIITGVLTIFKSIFRLISETIDDVMRIVSIIAEILS